MPATVAVGTGNDDVSYLGTRSYDSIADRRPYTQRVGAGLETSADMLVTYSGSGMNLAVAAGDAWVRGTNADQGMYRVHQSTSVTNLTVSNNGSANNRIDVVVLRIYDNDSEAAGSYKAQLEVIAGSTSTSGATLDNRVGAQDLSALSAPKTVLHLADVLVPPGASSIVGSNIRDRRRFATRTMPLLDYVSYDAVPLEFSPLAGRVSNRAYDCGAIYTGHQSAALVWCPRRMVGVTKIRWRYGVTTTIAASGTYIFALCDASGRFIAQTAATAFDTTAAPDDDEPVVNWTSSFNIDIGWHYLVFGVAGFSSAGVIRFNGLILPTGGDGTVSAGSGDGPTAANQAFGVTTGGTTLGSGSDVNTIRYMADQFGHQINYIGVPQVSLSIG